MRHLLLLALLTMATPALAAPQPYFRVVTSDSLPASADNAGAGSGSNDATPGTTGPDDGALPPDMTGGVPNVPGMGKEISTEAKSVGFMTDKLPGWQFDFGGWKAAPTLSAVVVQARGSYALIALQVRVRGCSTATVLLETSGNTTFQRTRDSSACALPTPEEWAAVAGQPVPALVSIVSSAAIPDLNRFAALGSGYTFSPVY